MKKVYIIDALRTPIANFGGTLKNISVIELGTLLVRHAIKKNKIPNSMVDGVIMGNVLQAGLGQNPARQCALRAGLAECTPAFTVNKVCGSGLKAIDIAYRNILSGYGGLFISGGMESMSNSPYLIKNIRWGNKMGDGKLIDEMITDGLWCPYNDIYMGSLVDELAEEYNISRQQQDSYSLKSHKKAVNAIESGRFKQEIVPVEYSTETGTVIFNNDEHPRKDTNLEKLSMLKSAFSRNGTITAGNASGISDGAAILIIASGEIIKKMNFKPLARILSISEVGVNPKVFGIAPIYASEIALETAKLKLKKIGLAEFNEAFAAQTIIVIKRLCIDKDIVNVNGGAIALGHPIGASGARITVTLIQEMVKRDIKYGLGSLCIGSGEGMAIIVEKYQE